MFAHIYDYKTFNNIADLDARMNSFNPGFDYSPQVQNVTDQHISPQQVQPVVSEKQTVVSTKSKTKSRTGKKLNKKYEFVDYSNDDTVLMAIQNDEKFLKLIKCIAKPVQATMYMYTTSEAIIFIISSSEYYPIVISKFNIKKGYIYLHQNVNLCIKFPYNLILDFISQTDKSLSAYTILLRNTDQSIKLEYHNSDHTSIKSTSSFGSVTKDSMIDIVFSGKITGPQYSEFDYNIGKNIDYIKELNNMQLLFLTESKDPNASNFSKYSKEKSSNHQILITPESIDINITTATATNSVVKKIADINSLNSPINPILYWNIPELKTKTLEMIKFTNMFKGADKIPNSNDLVYYAICKWSVLENTYIFVKIISNKNVKDKFKDKVANYDEHAFNGTRNDIVTFGSIFGTDETIIEYTLCRTL